MTKLSFASISQSLVKGNQPLHIKISAAGQAASLHVFILAPRPSLQAVFNHTF